MGFEDGAEDLLKAPAELETSNDGSPDQPLQRAYTSYNALHDFDRTKAESYKQQYGDMYFLRLAKLKPAVEKAAAEEWEGYELAGDILHRVDRVLDVRQGELCWVVGTVYLDMPLKPNILEDISKDHWIAAPPPRLKYISPDGSDKVMLEDESGRLRLVGAALESELLVTGCIIAVMGTEKASGDFEVIEIKVPDLPRQPARWALDKKGKALEAQREKERQEENKKAKRDSAESRNSKIALVSGLGITGDDGDTLSLDLLMEFLLGESMSPALQATASTISRLVIAGDSLSEASPIPIAREDGTINLASKDKKASASKKYGYDASTYNPAPTAQLDTFLSTLLPSLPVTLLPGASDPADVQLPQRPLHPALFSTSRNFSGPPTTTIEQMSQNESSSLPLHPATNPLYASISGRLVLATSGQPLGDISKYLEFPNEPAGYVRGNIDLMEATLRWRHIAPTAPDTLQSYPYQDREPFVIADGKCPALYVSGCAEDGFSTRVVRGIGEAPDGSDFPQVRCVCVPRFKRTGEVVLVDMETLEVEVVRLGVWNGGKGDE
ncbi:MAG: hypothetical protein M1831_006756 [Alyxoria varia]|nr:MAG: hypothetical protein M1831_006756 [Alyxoria varia]